MPETLNSSPTGIRKRFRIKDKLFTWVALRSRAYAQDWQAIPGLLSSSVRG